MLRASRAASVLLELCQKHVDPFASGNAIERSFVVEQRSARPLVSLFSTQASHNALNFLSSPHSLEYSRLPPPEQAGSGILSNVFLKIGGFYSKESTIMRAAGGLYDCVAEQATAPDLFDSLELPQDFQHQHALLCLHVWLLLVRLRPEGPDGKKLAQMMYDNFQDDVEGRVRKAGVKVRVGKQLTELEKQFYGSSLAYDKALKGESGETLASALLRNVYQADPGKKEAAVKLERYVRRELACLSLTDSAAVMSGNVRFSYAG